MASKPSDPRPVLGRVDRAGRLVAADPELATLQLEAGSTVGIQHQRDRNQHPDQMALLVPVTFFNLV